VTPVLAAVTGSTTAATIAPAIARTVPRRRRRSARGKVVMAALAMAITVTLAAGRVLGGGTPSSGDLVPSVASERSDLTSAKTASKRQEAATRLAEKYDRSAKDLRSEGAEGALVDAVESTARAYRRAASAIRRKDDSDYDDAVADAHSAEQAIKRAQGGVGDSQSDDPSDDEPDGGDEP
jgi:hypothetical protein